ncbi:MAG TPA: FmdB family zinc ribbon protein [Wenzhouxiangella sp.]|nr:FmdB family zinc ribbon protein [Wenzhouxiangella sp.]
MPIYEYRCQSCGHELEKLQKISDPPLVDCPECAQPALTKLISAAAFRLKGSGWYETDFKKDNRRNLAGDSKPETKGSGEAAASKSEGKPAKAADSGRTGSAAAGQAS